MKKIIVGVLVIFLSVFMCNYNVYADDDEYTCTYKPKSDNQKLERLDGFTITFDNKNSKADIDEDWDTNPITVLKNTVPGYGDSLENVNELVDFLNSMNFVDLECPDSDISKAGQICYSVADDDYKRNYDDMQAKVKGKCFDSMNVCELSAQLFDASEIPLVGGLVKGVYDFLGKDTKVGNFIDSYYAVANDDIIDMWENKNDAKKKRCKVYVIDKDDGEQSRTKTETINRGSVLTCNSYKKLQKKITKYYKFYKECKYNGQCTDNNGQYVSSASILSKSNLEVDKLKTYCKGVLNTHNSESPCIKKCFDVNKELANLQIKYRITDTPSSDCYLTDDVIAIVYNVLKWGKYIAPAIVIILSILDFIKAIAGNTEEDMKKAQGKFIKRLIITAILFLVPLIVNFSLKTIGLYNKECDIDNIFTSNK